jgi:hypothetical protein
MLQVCSSKCCICFQLFLILFACVSAVYFKCFVCFFVASVTFRFFKSRSGVAHGIRVESGGCASSPRAGDIRAAVPRVGAGDASAIKRRPDSADPCVDMRNGGGNRAQPWAFGQGHTFERPSAHQVSDRGSLLPSLGTGLWQRQPNQEGRCFWY